MGATVALMMTGFAAVQAPEIITGVSNFEVTPKAQNVVLSAKSVIARRMHNGGKLATDRSLKTGRNIIRSGRRAGCLRERLRKIGFYLSSSETSSVTTR